MLVRVGTIDRASHQLDISGNGGLREMEEHDVPKVTALWERYMQRFGMVPTMTQDDIRHQFLSGRGEGPVKKGRREGQVVWSYIFEVSPIVPHNSRGTWLIWNHRTRILRLLRSRIMFPSTLFRQQLCRKMQSTTLWKLLICSIMQAMWLSSPMAKRS